MDEVKKQIIIKDKRMASGGAKAFFSKLSRGLMLPIALLPIAGLFLGIGAGFENVIKKAMDGQNPTTISQATLIFVIMKNIGNVVFANLPIDIDEWQKMGFIGGNPYQILEQIEEYKEMGIEHIILEHLDIENDLCIDDLTDKVLNNF